MSWSHLKDLAAQHHRIESHGWSHRMLTSCSEPVLQTELRRSKQTLEDRLGQPVNAISVPHGRWSSRVVEACAAEGYREVFVSDPGVDTIDPSGVRIIGRQMITRTTSPDFLKKYTTTPSGRTGFSLSSAMKQGLRSLLGENLYHYLWCLYASDRERQALCRSIGSLSVLQLISSGGYYGAESMLVNLSRSLANSNCRPIVGVFRNASNPNTEVAERALEAGLTVETIPCAGRLDGDAIQHIRGLIEQYDISLVHAHGVKANSYAAAACAGLQVPMVATYHIDWPDAGKSLYLYHLVDRLIIHRFRKVAAVSAPIARSLKRFGLPGKKTIQIPNGIDLSPFLAIKRSLENGSGRAPMVGLVGRLTPQKGHTFLLQALPQVVARFPNVQFLFVGEGPLAEELSQQAAKLGIQQHVRFVGQRKDMAAVYAELDLLVLPSINEGMPMVLLEALAAGLAAVATRVGEVPVLIREGDTGALVEPRDVAGLAAAIIRLLSHPEERQRLGDRGRQFVSDHFSAHSMASRYEAVYREVLA